MSHFGELLKKARKHTWLTQKELGEKVGVDDSYISRLERGVYQPPSREVAEGLADATSMGNKPVTLYVSTKDMDAIDRFVFLLEANVAGAEDVKEIRLVKIEDDETDEEEDKADGGEEKQNQNVVGHGRGLKSGTQVKHTPLPTIANPAVAIPWKAIPDAPLGTTEEEMDEIVSLIDSASLSDEEEERINATLFEIAKQLLSLIEVQRKMRKED